MKQIGNAFPPVAGKAFFESIRKSLEATDRDAQAALLNGDLDEDDALQAAMRESLASTRQPTYIELLDSSEEEDDDDLHNLRNSMARLSVEPSAATRNPFQNRLNSATAGPSTSRKTEKRPAILRAPSEGHISRERPPSSASSHTLDGSPSPGPAKRQRVSLEPEDRHRGNGKGKGKGKGKCVEVIDLDAASEDWLF